MFRQVMTDIIDAFPFVVNPENDYDCIGSSFINYPLVFIRVKFVPERNLLSDMLATVTPCTNKPILLVGNIHSIEFIHQIPDRNEESITAVAVKVFIYSYQLRIVTGKLKVNESTCFNKHVLKP